MTGTLSVPWLRSGTGSTPAHGGCILQVIDWIDRNQWSDEPPCVHPVLRRLAIRANDMLPDDQRQKLLDLAPRLMGTNSDDNMLSVNLAVFCARQVLPIWEKEHPQDDLLVATLDEYDRLTSRTEVKHVDLSPAAVAMSEAKA